MRSLSVFEDLGRSLSVFEDLGRGLSRPERPGANAWTGIAIFDGALPINQAFSSRKRRPVRPFARG